MRSSPHVSTFELWYGRDEPPVAAHPLRAGPVTALLVGCDLRDVRFGGVQIAQRIYVAIRDRNWGTVPGEMSNLVVDAGNDRFLVRFDVVHRQHDIDLTWRGEIVGATNGTMIYAIDAVASVDLTYKLVGLNVHHGMEEYAGRSYHGRSPDGPIDGTFPTLVEPQLIADQTEVPIFPAVESLTVQLMDEVAVRFDFEGDTFEFEDQRNWSDASFKSQSFPPRRNGFFRLRQGDHVRQRVIVTPIGMPPPVPPDEARVRFTIGETSGRSLPAIGFGMAGHGRALSRRETDLLRALRPDHLRVDLHLADEAHEATLVSAVAVCRALGCGLEAALFVSDDADQQLDRLAGVLARDRPPIVRVLVFHEAEQATTAHWLALARQRLRSILPHASFAGGTNANFCELNRHRPAAAPDDGVVYAITPQIHAFDETSLVENLAAQAATLVTAHAFGDERPVIISPVTLKQRFNAVATSDTPALDPGELPPQVDPRQMSLFGAGWTLGSLHYLTAGGAASVTYYETTGWCGVIETDTGSPLPERFPSQPGMVFPVYHVFADLADWKGGEVLASRSSHPLSVVGLAIRLGDATCFLLANLTPEEQRVVVGPLTTIRVAVRRLNEVTSPVALFEPGRFRSLVERLALTGTDLVLSLAPFEVVRVEAGRGAF